MYSLIIPQVSSISKFLRAHLFHIKSFINNSKLAHTTPWSPYLYIVFELSNTLGKFLGYVVIIIWQDQISIIISKYYLPIPWEIPLVFIILWWRFCTQFLFTIPSYVRGLASQDLHIPSHTIPFPFICLSTNIPLFSSPLASTKLACWHLYQVCFLEGQYISHITNKIH